MSEYGKWVCIMSREDRDEVMRVLREAVCRLEESMSGQLIPEVGTNIAYALPGARTPDDVAAVEGRIVRLAGKAHAVGDVSFGASDHVARIVLTAMKFDPVVRAAANIRYSPEIVSVLEDMLLEVCSFDRTKEPPGIRTMDWGVASCCKSGVPDVIFDRGGMGKEPMIRILGEDPGGVVNNIIKLSARIMIE
jgi:predicted fused transcriptional regulator/phosphomethylpyrimidine kinase